jgi:hypothetical protein
MACMFVGKLARCACLIVLFTAAAVAQPFTVVVYNVENLFDADGRAVYDDYQPAVYQPRHFRTKLLNIAEVLSRFNDGRGPDIILFQEIEVDQTPQPGVDPVEVLNRYAGRSVADLLSKPNLPVELATLPAEVWLLRALADRGLDGYVAVSGSDQGAHEGGNERAVKVVTFTRFPVRAVRQHPIRDARNILETELTVEGATLYVFNNHWKSGASDPALEEVRRQNAQVLRARLDEILREDPQADIIIGGDFNSHYNQNVRFPGMRPTAVNDVLRSQGNELAIRGRDRDLYNLWFELPPEGRGSDTYRGEWGALMQMMITRGLYDYRGVQYVDNSFGVARFVGLNADPAGAPVRWQPSGANGAGFSDHLPIQAQFRVVTDNRPQRWLALTRASDGVTRAQARRVDYSGVDLEALAVRPGALPNGVDLRDGSWSGRLFVVDGEVVPDRNPRVRYLDQEYEVYGVDEATRDRLHAQRRSGRMSFYGELGTFRGRWQFVVRDPGWVR